MELQKRATMHFRTDGNRIRDSYGRHRVFHGINLVQKGHTTSTAEGTFQDRGFEGRWAPSDIQDLADRGFTLVRLGVIWAAVEPTPGVYDEDYLRWLYEQLDLIAEAGMYVLLDAHQDLYSQAFGDGAPTWATLTSHPYSPTDLWSDAYLESPAVHEALDAFWSNALGPGGVGIQDRFAHMWAHVVTRLGSHHAVLGYDLLNEPTPGSLAPEIFGAVLHVFAQATGQEFEEVMADFSDPEQKFAQLDHLETIHIHRSIGDDVAPLLAQFETEVIHPFMQKVSAAIRGAGGTQIIAREHNYFANLGIPSGQPPLDDDCWVYSPHGYDLTVDTEAITFSSNTRAGTIFSRAHETAQSLQVPVVVGEWGALTLRDGVRPHGEFLIDLFDSYGWSWTYWVWEEGFASSEAAQVLTRPRPIAFAGDGLEWAVTETGFSASWRGAHVSKPSIFYIPYANVTVTCDSQPVNTVIDGNWVQVPPGAGNFHLTAEG